MSKQFLKQGNTMLDATYPAIRMLCVTREIKVCHGCIQEGFSRYEFHPQNKWTNETLLAEGILERWQTWVAHGKQSLGRIVVRHVDDHPNCYNYTTKIVKETFF